MFNRKFYMVMMAFLFLTGCYSSGGNIGQLQIYKVPVMEAEWIRNGEPIEFEKESWYPVDDVEHLLDSEVIPVGEYRGVQIFVEKVDVRPYERLYSKFNVNQFRYFEKKKDD